MQKLQDILNKHLTNFHCITKIVKTIENYFSFPASFYTNLIIHVNYLLCKKATMHDENKGMHFSDCESNGFSIQREVDARLAFRRLPKEKPLTSHFSLYQRKAPIYKGCCNFSLYFGCLIVELQFRKFFFFSDRDCILYEHNKVHQHLR